MNATSDGSGRLLADALSEQPTLTLSFYSFGITLRKVEMLDGGGQSVSEYPVDAGQVAAALAAKARFDTGLLGGNTLLVRHEGARRLVVEYRPAGMAGIYIEGIENALRIPLPPLVLIRVGGDGGQVEYRLYAVKCRPEKLDTPLFHAPLPNVFGTGSICWGTVPKADADALHSASLDADWRHLLGSPFGNHACSGKSRAEPDDIRKMLIALDAGKARTYPKRDLVAVRKTLADAIGGAA